MSNISLKNLHLGLKENSLDKIDIFDQYIFETVCQNMFRMILSTCETLLCKLTHLKYIYIYIMSNDQK